MLPIRVSRVHPKWSSGLISARLRYASAILLEHAGIDPSGFIQSGPVRSIRNGDRAAKRYKQNWVNAEEVDPAAEEPQFEAGVLYSGRRSGLSALASLLPRFFSGIAGNRRATICARPMIRLAVDCVPDTAAMIGSMPRI